MSFKLTLVDPANMRFEGVSIVYQPTYQEHRFLIAEVEGGYQLTGDNYDQTFYDLKAAVQGAYLEWGG